VFELAVQAGLIAPGNEDVVRSGRDDVMGVAGLGMQGIVRKDLPCQVQAGQ